MIKTFSKLGLEGNFFNVIKCTKKKITNTIFHGKKLKLGTR